MEDRKKKQLAEALSHGGRGFSNGFSTSQNGKKDEDVRAPFFEKEMKGDPCKRKEPVDSAPGGRGGK